MTQEQAEILRKMTPEERLRVAGSLYETARELKAAGLRAQHPDWAEAQVQDEVRKIFPWRETRPARHVTAQGENLDEVEHFGLLVWR